MSQILWLVRIPGTPFRAGLLLFALAFAIRLVVLRLVPPEYLVPHTRWELEAIAHSLATTGRFADPYAIPTGPTAHVPPLYPFLLSLVWRLFGLGPAGGHAGWMMGFAFASLQCALLPWFSVRLGLGLAPGIIVGVITAVLAGWPVHVEPPAAIALGLLLVAFRRRWTTGPITTRGSVLLGVATGLAFHLQPALLPVVAGCLLFELWWLRGWRRWLRTAGVAVVMLLVCVPWTWRNLSTLHGLFFIRSNLGLELRVGNHEGAVADLDAMPAEVNALHPRQSRAEAEQVRELGEAEYMRQAGSRARAWIAENPGAYARLSAQRALAFWTRSTESSRHWVPATLVTLLALLGGWRGLRGRTAAEGAVVLIPLALFPLVYYFVDYLPRYRLPVIWLWELLAATEVVRQVRRHSGSRGPSAPC